MRLKLVLKIVEGTVLPCNYMYELSSCLYKVLNEGNPVFTAWLHDKGYCKEKKAFKLFTFSNFYFPCFRIEGDRIFIWGKACVDNAGRGRICRWENAKALQ